MFVFNPLHCLCMAIKLCSSLFHLGQVPHTMCTILSFTREWLNRPSHCITSSCITLHIPMISSSQLRIHFRFSLEILQWISLQCVQTCLNQMRWRAQLNLLSQRFIFIIIVLISSYGNGTWYNKVKILIFYISHTIWYRRRQVSNLIDWFLQVLHVGWFYYRMLLRNIFAWKVGPHRATPMGSCIILLGVKSDHTNSLWYLDTFDRQEVRVMFEMLASNNRKKWRRREKAVHSLEIAWVRDSRKSNQGLSWVLLGLARATTLWKHDEVSWKSYSK